MAEKDFREKKLEDFDDVFADIINVLLFHGENRVDENDLESGMVHSAYKVEDKFEEQERDVKKFWKSGRIRLAVFGLENQTGEDSDYIFRDFGYDGAEYRDQVRRRNDIRRKNAKLKKENTNAELLPVPDFYPVVTLVLYFGDTHWTGSLNLKDHLKIPAGLEDYVSDYHANLFEIAFLSEEQVEQFKSDFRYVAEFFVATRMHKEGKEPAFTITHDHPTHVEEFIELMNAITYSKRFSEIPRLIKERGGGSMYTLLFDEAEERGEKRGEKRGVARGEAKKEAKIILKKVQKGKTLEQTADEMETTPDEIRKCYDAVCKYVSSFTGEELIEKIVSEVIDEENDRKDIV